MRIRPGHTVVLFYVAAALALTWPLVVHFGSILPAVYGEADPLLQLFLIGWGWHAVTTHPLGAMNAPIFYPEPRTLTYSDHMLGEAVLAGPVTSAFGVGAGYDFLVVLSFVLSGWGVYRLARLVGVSRGASCLAGFLFAFSPYRFSNLGELIQLQTQFLPLGLFFAIRFLRSARVRDGIGAGLALAVQSTFGWYATFHLLIAYALLLAWKIARDRGLRGVPWTRTALVGAGTVLLILPLAFPYLIQHRALPEFHRSLGDTALWSADLLDYVQLPPENVLAWIWPSLRDAQGLFPGVVALALAVTALWRRRLSGTPAYFALLGAGGFILSLGPILQVAGHRIWIPLPYAVCYYVIPGFSSMRAPVRFAVLVALAAALLAGFGLDRLRRRFPRRARDLVAAALGASVLLACSPDLPFVATPNAETAPPVYSWLRDRPGKEPILELPVPASETEETWQDVLRQFYVLDHGKPRLDGASGFTSRRYQEFRRRIQAFPEHDALEAACGMGAKLVVIHYGDYEPVRQARLREAVEASPDLRRLAVFDDDVVYALACPGEDAGAGD